jgi:hypothetical protein
MEVMKQIQRIAMFNHVSRRGDNLLALNSTNNTDPLLRAAVETAMEKLLVSLKEKL